MKTLGLFVAITLLTLSWTAAMPLENLVTVNIFSESKYGPEAAEKCEDGYFHNEHFLLVVDGASDKSGRLYNGHTGGWHCKEAVLSVFRSLKGQESPPEILDQINSRLAKIYDRFRIDPKAVPEHRFSSVLVWYSFHSNSLHAIGDCKARVDGVRFNDQEKLVDKLNSEFRSRVIEELGDEPTGDKDLGREYILPLLKAQAHYQNNPEAPERLQYWVVDGTNIPASKIVSKKLRAAPKTIELSSDGYAEFPDKAEIQAYEEKLQALLDEDPSLSKRVKSTKGLTPGKVSFDDRTVLIYRRP